MSPLRRQSAAIKVWRVLYPIGIHLGISQIVGSIVLNLLTRYTGQENYYQYVIFATGLTGILAMIPAWYLYKKDRVSRKAGGLVKTAQPLTAKELLLSLGMGAGFAISGNMTMGILQYFFQSTYYQETMTQITEGQSVLAMVFWMGIVAPFAEEMIFRWLIFLRLRDYVRLFPAAMISSLLFGIYHGNVMQAVYASLLGLVFAYVMEMSGSLWSCVLLHMGANIWATVLSEYGVRYIDSNWGLVLMIASMAFLFSAGAGLSYFIGKGEERENRAV